MDGNRFNKEVRPYLMNIRIGQQGIAFDRLDLDAWVDDYKKHSGRQAVTQLRSKLLWDAHERQAFINGAISSVFIIPSYVLKNGKQHRLVKNGED